MRGHSRQDDLLMRLKQCLGTIDGANKEKLIVKKRQFGKENLNKSTKEWESIGFISKNNSKRQEIVKSRDVSLQVNRLVPKKDEKQNYQQYKERNKQISYPKQRMEFPLRKYCEEAPIEPYKKQKSVYDKYQEKYQNQSYTDIRLFEAPLSRPNHYQPKKYDYSEKERAQTPKSGQFCFQNRVMDRYHDHNLNGQERYHLMGNERASSMMEGRMMETRMNQTGTVDIAQKLRKINELNDRINRKIENIVHNFGYKN